MKERVTRSVAPALGWLLLAPACAEHRERAPRVAPPVAPQADEGTDEETGAPTENAHATLPSEILDLTNWALTLPIGDPDEPTHIEQTELSTYTIDPYFEVGETGDVVVFLAEAGGVTTDSSMFARSELREMTGGGHTEAAWSTTSGRHTMTITQAITHLPEVVPHLVAGQVHGGDEYALLVRLDGARLWVKSDGEDAGVLDPDYALGTEFTLRITAADGRIDVYYDDLTHPAVSVPYAASGCFFKAGAYAQSNTEYGDAPDAYAEVQIRSLVVTHE